MNLRDIPFNVWLLAPNAANVQTMRAVKALDTYDSTGTTFHPDGLFSIETFGRIGSEARDSTPAYIDLKTKILHPEVYLLLVSLRSLYGGILSGKQYAKWDAEESDFVNASEVEGQTGYSFFMSYWKDLKIKKNKSDTRNEKIDVIEKYRGATMSRHYVVPAGLRDVQIDERGRTTEDEVNDHYRRLLTIANTIVNADIESNEAFMDAPRFALQKAAVAIFQMYTKTFGGKRGWFQGKLQRRNTLAGSRNVITAMYTSSSYIGGPDSIKATDTEIGFTQTLRAALPFTLHALQAGVLGEVFDGKSNQVWLVNRKSLKRELVDISPEVMDSYGTRPGIERLINRFFVDSLRTKPIVIGSHYLALIYVDNEKFKVFTDIDELPAGFNKDNVYPLTLSDLLYTSCYMPYKDLVGTITRYPVTGTGSIYPTTMKVRTTTVSEVKRALGRDWQDLGDEFVAPAFPQRDKKARWLEGLSVHAIRLGGLGGDYDGDKCASPILFSKEARDEITNYFKKRSAYVSVGNQLTVSAAIPTVTLVVANLTGDPID